MKNKQILFIYDFDDTLFPSFDYTNNKQYNNYKWKLLDDKIFIILYNSLIIGNVIILSDGMPLWINNILSFLPKTCKLINNYINVKHIKMLKKPSFYQLIYELILLNKNINYFINNDNNKEFLFYLYNIKNNTASF